MPKGDKGGKFNEEPTYRPRGSEEFQSANEGNSPRVGLVGTDRSPYCVSQLFRPGENAFVFLGIAR